MSEPLELVVSAPPHIRAKETVSGIIGWVILALLPVTLMSVYVFGLYAAKIIILSVGTTVLTEAAIQRLRKIPITIGDGSAALTGLLLALILPPKVPWWIPVIGGFVAIALGKQVFGGLGYNVFNPALVGRAVLMVSWAELMAQSWLSPLGRLDAVSTATPLALMKQARAGLAQFHSVYYYKPLLFTNPGGCLGEVSALLLLVGVTILLYKRIIEWRIPAGFLGTVFVLSLFTKTDPLFQVLAGGLLLGAFFMATDYVTSPVTPRGALIFGTGCGFITVLLRCFSNVSEGVTYAILFMNAFTPLIDRYTMPRIYGKGKRREKSSS